MPRERTLPANRSPEQRSHRLDAEIAEIARRLIPTAEIRLGPGIQATSHLRGPSDLTRARTELGYAPRYTLEQGMADWLSWLLPRQPDRQGGRPAANVKNRSQI